MSAICQSSLPYDPFGAPKLPGITPFEMQDWLIRDEAFAAQMALRDRMVQDQRPAVLAIDNAAYPAAEELLDMVLEHAFPGAGAEVVRPDGVMVPIDRDDPMGTVARLVQEDMCILERRDGEEHILTAAALCFPAGWRLAEKMGQPLTGIHRPVAEYDDTLARRVQRLFHGIQPGRPLWRFNALWYEKPELFQPRSEGDIRPDPGSNRKFLRSERQCLVRLPKTRAVVFSIHTYVIAEACLRGAGKG